MIEDPKNLWALFHENFKLGEDILIITDDDQLYCGAFKGCDNYGIFLSHPRAKDKKYQWDQIRFISHSGFPVKKLRGADGSNLIEMNHIMKKYSHHNDPTREILEHILSWVRHDGPKSKVRGPVRAIFGDPFEFEAVKVELFNPDNYDHDELYEEVLSLTAKDRAHAELYDLGTIYHAEVA